MPRNPFYRWPLPMLVAGLVICLPFFWQLKGIKIGTDARTLLEGDQRSLASFEKIMEILNDDIILVVSLRTDAVFSRDGLAAIANLSEALQETDGIIDVKSLTHSSKPVRDGLAFRMEPVVPGLPAPTDAQLTRLREFCLANPLIRNVIVAPDEKHSLITATFRRDVSTPELRNAFAQDIEAALAPFREKGHEILSISLPMVESEVYRNLQSDVRRFLPVAAGITFVLLLIFLRSPVAVLLVCALQGVGLLLVPGIVLATGREMTIFNLLLLPLAAGVHLTLLSHTVSNLLRFRRIDPSRDPVPPMLTTTFRSCLFASLTTIAGLLSLLLSDLPIVREVGLLGALAIAGVFLLTFGPGVALMRLLFPPLRSTSEKKKKKKAASAPPTPAAEPSPKAVRHARWTAARKIPILASAAAVFALSLLGLSLVRTDIRAVEFLKPSSPTRQAIEHFDSVYGGVNVVQIDFDTGTPGGINALPFLRYLNSLQSFSESQPEISGAHSYPQLLSMMNQIWDGEAPGSYQLPHSLIKLNIFIFALTSQDFPFLRGLCDPAMQSAHLVLRTPDMPTDAYLAVIRRILEKAKQTAPDGVVVSARKGLYTIAEAERSILRSQIRTAGTTVLGIGLVLTLLWRSPRLAMITLTVNIVPVLLVLGLAGFLDIPLNAISVMVAAVAFGIAVDDSVHFITSFLKHRSEGNSLSQATALALASKTRPIILTSLILVGIFATFLAFSFPPVVHFGLLCAAAFLASLVTTLVFLPALVQKRA